MSLVYRIPSLLGQMVKKVQSKRALRSEILSFQTRSSELDADGIVYSAVSSVIVGKPVFRVAGPVIGYQASWHFMSDYHNFIATAVPASGKDTHKNDVTGFAFEISHSGTYADGPSAASRIYTAMVEGASQIAPPISVTSARRLSGSSGRRVVKLSDGSETPDTSGTGFFISEDGYLVSNHHVVKNAAQIRLVTFAGLFSAKMVKVDAANDLALLKAEGTFTPLPIAASRGVKLGSTVATVGFPNIGLQGFAPKLAKGEIASLSGAGDDARYFQISVPVQPGNSGGALVDERGNVVGVVSAKLNASAALRSSGALPENVNYAVKSSYLLSFLESVPEVAAKLKEPNTKEKKFEDVVKEAEQAAVLLLVY